jgi:formamidopyrimidine-DNA glycosylase
MPELPEVETIRAGLEQLLPERQVAQLWHDGGKSFVGTVADVDAFLLGAKVTAVRRRAKVLLVDLTSGYSLVIHLKMTGQLVFRSREQNFGAGHPTDSLVGDLPDRSTRVSFDFADGSHLFFNDQRKFGWVRLLPTAEIANLDFFKKVGPEPLAANFSAEDFTSRLLRRPKSGIKAVLLDQTIIAGVGNIYADESLWGAKIHPETKVSQLTYPQMQKLFTSLQAVLKLSIAKGGSTDKNYVNAEGKKGNYLSFANVFRHQGQPCPRCGTTIIKTRVASRGTHLCPNCQRMIKL